MAKLLFYCDLHAADQNPRSRGGSYKEDILNKLKEIVSLANSLDVDYLVNGADTFDRKDARSVTHSLVYDIIEILKALNPGIRHVTCVGTHDVPTGRLDKVPRQPLGILETAGVIEVWGEPKMKPNPLHTHAKDGISPWTPDDELWDDAQHLMLHFVPARYDLDKDTATHDSGLNYSWRQDGPRDSQLTVITVAHGMITPPGRGFFDDFTPAETIAAQTQADLVCYGHPHTPDGVYKAGGDATFVATGSISRRDASPYNRTRVPQVALIKTDPNDRTNYTVELISLKSARPGGVVFSEVIKDELDENESGAKLNEFVQNLAGAKIADDAWGLPTLIAEIRSSDAPDETKRLRRRAAELLEVLHLQEVPPAIHSSHGGHTLEAKGRRVPRHRGVCSSQSDGRLCEREQDRFS